MAKVTRLEQPPMIGFCGICLDDAGRCLFDAVQAQEYGEPVERVAEVVPGYPDRILPRDDAAAAILKKRTLTNLYNARPAWLDHAHRALDEAVAEAYGWGDDWRAGLLTDDEILARLFHLNQGRAAAATGGKAW